MADLYKKILDIKVKKNQKPNYYVLLSINLFESDGQVIHKAGLQQIKKLKEWQLHPEQEIQEQVQTLLNDVSMACSVLEITKKKEMYDKKLAEHLGIMLADNVAYKAPLSNTVKLRTCPNCGVEVSQLAILCIDCGYHFAKKKVIKTEKGKVITNPLYEFGGVPRSYQKKSIIGQYAKKVFSYLFDTSVKIFRFITVIALLTIAVFILISIWPKSNAYTIDSSSAFRSYTEDILDNSPLWQFYFDYCSKTQSTPYINVKVLKSKFERGYTSLNLYKIKIYNTKTKRLIASDTIQVSAKDNARDKYVQRAKYAFQNAAKKMYWRLLDNDSKFGRYLDENIDKQPYKTRRALEEFY